MAQSVPALVVGETREDAIRPCPDMAAATGIASGLAISALFWVAIGYAVHSMVG